jgi:hypothetical protein
MELGTQGSAHDSFGIVSQGNIMIGVIRVIAAVGVLAYVQQQNVPLAPTSERTTFAEPEEVSPKAKMTADGPIRKK